MKKPRSALAALAALLMLVACDAPTASPDPTGLAPVDGANRSATYQADAPRLLLARGGATVDTFTRVEFVLHLDRERGLLSVHAPSDFCTTFRVGALEVHEVTTPSRIDQRTVQSKGTGLPVTVYEADSFADAGITGAFDFAGFSDILADFPAFCAFLAGPDRVAEGTARRVSTLSNASFAVTWTGALERVDGGTARLTEVYQLTADARDPGDTSDWAVHASKVLLH